MRIGVVLGSMRPQRLGERVARLVMAQAARVPGAAFEVLDLAGYELPFFDEPVAPLRNRDRQQSDWAAKVARFVSWSLGELVRCAAALRTLREPSAADSPRTRCSPDGEHRVLARVRNSSG